MTTPATSKCRSLLLLSVLISPIASPAIAPNLGGPPIITDRLWLYDTEGNVGAIIAGNVSTPNIANIGGQIQVFLDSDLSIPFYQQDDILTISAIEGPPNSAGHPYYVRRHHPAFGCLSSFSYIGARYGSVAPAFVLPLPFSQHKISTRTSEADPQFVGPSGHAAALKLEAPYVVDSPGSFTLAVELVALYHEATQPLFPPTITIDYLPGNSRTEPTIWTPQFLINGFFSIYWADNGEEWPDILQEGLPVPEAPIRVTISYLGHTSDTITLQIEDLKNHHWRPIIGPAGGPAPSGFFPNAGILDQGVSDALLGDCAPSATFAGTLDPNIDGVTDSADFFVPKAEQLMEDDLTE